MKFIYHVALLAIVILMLSFSKDYSCFRAGIKGHVYLEAGNRMPTIGEPLPEPRGIKTSLYIYELTNINDVQRDGQSAFYHSINTSLVKEVETDDKGYFRVKLKPGNYSLFVKKGDRFYSSQFDEKNNIHPVQVKPGKMTRVVFKANYGAVY
jgi:hypothetical protein